MPSPKFLKPIFEAVEGLTDDAVEALMLMFKDAPDTAATRRAAQQAAESARLTPSSFNVRARAQTPQPQSSGSPATTARRLAAAAQTAAQTPARVRRTPTPAPLAVARDVTPPTPEPFAITGRAEPGPEVLRLRAEQMALPANQRLVDNGLDPVFDRSPESYLATESTLLQSDPLAVQAALPRRGDAGRYPLRDRVRPLIDQQEAVARRLAEKAEPYVGSELEYFYHTAPIIEGLQRAGGSREGALSWLQDQFAPTFAGSSPRTQTPQNMRNATLLSYLQREGIPLGDFYAQHGNYTGYPMIGDTHYPLAEAMLANTHDPLTRPKPHAFGRATAGDLSHIPADTHNIRGALMALNEIAPGEMPLDWLNPAARAGYVDTGVFDPASDINDSLQSMPIGGRKMQVEYGPVADVTYRAAEMLGRPPAGIQSLGWFGSGSDTGLRSPPQTITGLLDSQLNTTGQALGISPMEVLRLLQEGRIPLLRDGGRVDFAVRR